MFGLVLQSSIFLQFLFMKTTFSAALLLTSLAATAQTTPVGPPATPQRPVTDTYFGKKVVDNYRWLENTNSPEVQAWFKAQGNYTTQTLDQIPGRDRLIKTFEDYDKFLGAKGARKEGHLFDPYQPVDIVRKELDKIKGHLVWMPLDFLCDAGNMAEKGVQVNSITESIYT